VEAELHPGRVRIRHSIRLDGGRSVGREIEKLVELARKAKWRLESEAMSGEFGGSSMYPKHFQSSSIAGIWRITTIPGSGCVWNS
jgi:hypothetical protein